MARTLVMLSGRVRSGKTMLAEHLRERFAAEVFSTRDLLQRLVEANGESRAGLQAAGERLDFETEGRWLAQPFAEFVARSGADAVVVLDAVRVQTQMDAVRELLGSRVVHIHLRAPQEVLAERYAQQPSTGIAELPTYAEVAANPTEAGVDDLAVAADVVIDTERSTPDDVLVRAASRLGLYGGGAERLVDVLVGGQWGSEGKGNIVHAIAPEYDLLVRVGGPNAGHKVPWAGGTFTHHALPSGTGATEARLLLGPGAVIYPPQLLDEIVRAEVTATRLTIDEQATIITDEDIAAEQLLVASIGSTGQGVGAATARRIVGRQEDDVQLAGNVEALKPYIGSAQQVLEDAYARGARVLLEGTQGTGLSLYHGHYPHVTSRDTTVSGVMAGAGIGPTRVRRTMMVCRTYPIRVQDPAGRTSGPMGREIDWPTVARRSGIELAELDEVERTSTTGRSRRVAEFSWVQLRRAMLLNDPTDIALTFVDYLDVENRKARRFEQLSADTIRFIEEVERVAGAPVALLSTRFGHRSVIDRRSWARAGKDHR